MNTYTFKGGNLTLRSGGIGPDDYLFRCSRSRSKWFKVIIRHGPDQAMEYRQDLTALGSILRSCERVAVGDLQRIASKRSKLRTVSAHEFLQAMGE